jgi:hypothetical protein
MKLSFQSIGRVILFVAALVILYYEFIVAPRHGLQPNTTIVIATLGVAAAAASIKLGGK